MAFLVASAWLHDIGYAAGLQETGFHPVDGARHLRSAGWPPPLCLVQRERLPVIGRLFSQSAGAGQNGRSGRSARVAWAARCRSTRAIMASRMSTGRPGSEPKTSFESTGARGPQNPSRRVHGKRAGTH